MEQFDHLVDFMFSVLCYIRLQIQHYVFSTDAILLVQRVYNLESKRSCPLLLAF
jgi:hypothetical protein